MSRDELDAVHELAALRGYTITADYVRELIEADAELLRQPLKFEVDRGGDRTKKAP